jgi:hypothetical protein
MNANTKAQKQLIGTWKITAVEDRKDEYDPNSEWTYPYGKNPKGYFVYDNTGHVMIQIMKTPPGPPFASGDDEKPTAEEVKTAFTGYFAYFGTYTVDAAKNVVIHHVEGSLKPSFIGTDQPALSSWLETILLSATTKRGAGFWSVRNNW